MRIDCIRHALFQAVTLKPHDWACCSVSCYGCGRKSFSEFMWLARLRNHIHERFCFAVKRDLVRIIREYEEHAARYRRPVQEWLQWIHPASYTAEQVRQAKLYCDAAGLDWASVGSAVKEK